MDTESKSAIKFLQALSEVHKSLDEFSVSLRKRPEVKDATVYRFTPKHNYFGEHNSDGSFVHYSSGDFGVSATLISGFVTDWWLELGWNENTLRLEYNVLSNNSEKDGSDVIIPFPECRSSSLDAFIKQLTNAIEELIATANGEALPS